MERLWLRLVRASLAGLATLAIAMAFVMWLAPGSEAMVYDVVGPREAIAGLPGAERVRMPIRLNGRSGLMDIIVAPGDRSLLVESIQDLLVSEGYEVTVSGDPSATVLVGSKGSFAAGYLVVCHADRLYALGVQAPVSAYLNDSAGVAPPAFPAPPLSTQRVSILLPNFAVAAYDTDLSLTAAEEFYAAQWNLTEGTHLGIDSGQPLDARQRTLIFNDRAGTSGVMHLSQGPDGRTSVALIAAPGT